MRDPVVLGAEVGKRKTPRQWNLSGAAIDSWNTQGLKSMNGILEGLLAQRKREDGEGDADAGWVRRRGGWPGAGESDRVVWTGRRRDYESGQFEVSICRSRVAKYPEGRAFWRGVRRCADDVEAVPSEGAREVSARRSRGAVRDICKAMGADYMLTLTTRENCQDLEHFALQFKRFRTRVAKLMEFQYCAVPEIQVRGAIHLHVAVRGRQNLRLLRAIWQSLWGGKGQAGVHVRSPYKEKHLRYRIAGYISKYIGKDVSLAEFNKKRYWASRNIVRPERHVWFVAEGEFGEDQALRVGVLMGSGRERQMMYCGVRGVFWMACGPLDPNIRVLNSCPF